MTNLLLIHGLNGSGDHSSTGKTLREIFGNVIHTPNMPNNPIDWHNFLLDYIARNFVDKPLILIGNSTGGLFATHLAHEQNQGLILINPVTEATDLLPFIGLNKKFASGEEWLLTEDNVASLCQYAMATPTLPALVFLGRNDEVLDSQKTEKRYRQNSQVIVNDNAHQYRLSTSDIIILHKFYRDYKCSALFQRAQLITTHTQ